MAGVRSSSELEPGSAAAAFGECQRQLRSPDASTRRAAAQGLRAFGPQAEVLLRRALVDPDGQVRKAALPALSQIGALDTQDALLELLESAYPDVREHAAQKLGEVGDDHALLPLIEVYTRSFTGGSARKQRYLGRWILVAWLMWVILTLWPGASGHLEVKDLILVILFSATNFSGLRSRSDAWRVYLAAILQIAERNPRPELHRLVPDLHCISANRIQHYPEAREAARAAATRIETLTTAIQDLPLPAAATAPGKASLPLPASEAPIAMEPVQLERLER